MKKKQMQVFGMILAGVLLILFSLYMLSEKTDFSGKKNKEDAVGERAQEETLREEGWSIDAMKKGRVTAIDAEIQYDAFIGNLQEAQEELKLFGEEQRTSYSNPKVTKIEKRLEKKYDIFAVNLGEMDLQTAKDVEKAVKYMYQHFPKIRGTLTNITLANLNTFKTGNLALTQTREYIINGNFGVCPFVVKHEILLSASAFLNRSELLRKCEEGAESDYWPKGMDISTLVVHELGHQVLNACAMKHFQYDHVYYITEENQDAFSDYIMDSLAANQTFPKLIVDEAYARWEKKNPGQDYETFCKSISGYAKGIQDDGGISYCETVAEAIADVYLNKKKASQASFFIEEVIKDHF